MKRLFVFGLVLLGLSLSALRADTPDDQYIRIYNIIQQADSFSEAQQTREAVAKYTEAQVALQKFQKGYPDWNPSVTRFRLNYVAQRISELSSPGGARTKPSTAPVSTPIPAQVAPRPAPAPSSSSSDLENQMGALKAQLQQAQADKALLEAKLKEALSVQPASVDPRELARAEDKIKSLEKERDLLKVTLAQSKAATQAQTATNAKPAAVGKLPARYQEELATANRQLAEQTQRADALAAEKKVLQNRLDSLSASKSDTSALKAAQKALVDSNRRLAEQTQLASKLTVERDALQARLQGSSTNGQALASLQAENRLLKKQLAELRAAPAATSAKTPSPASKKARTQLAALESDNAVLRLEKMALENRLKALSTNTAPVVVATPPASAEVQAKLIEVERERDELQKKLDAANKELATRKRKVTSKQVADMESQIAALRAKLEVYEAKRVPFTAEELALLKNSQARPDTADTEATKKSRGQLPASAALLMAEAQRDFANNRLDKAEAKYLQVLRQDDKNVYTLANLAAIEIEMNQLDQADKHLKTAMAEAPNDAYTLSVLGRLRFKQTRYDDALDALGRAAKLDPDNAQIQNFLGITLGQKGMRVPAETALRKAVQLDPGYGDAHNNLAVIYISEQPPAVELARWHYEKALAAGMPRNPSLEKMFETKKSAGGVQ